MRLRLLGPLALVVVVLSCGGESPNSGSISHSETVALVERIVRAGLSGLISAGPAAALRTGAAGTSGAVTYQVNYQQGCTTGSITVTGTLSGTLDNQTGAGNLNTSVTERFAECAAVVGGRSFVLTGSIALSGVFAYLEGAPEQGQTTRFRGDFNWQATPGGPGRCRVDALVDYNAYSPIMAVNGAACGYDVAF